MEHLTLHHPTDTAHPQEPIPIYFIHCVTQPLCHNPLCWCNTQKADMAPLLHALQIGSMTLYQITSAAESSKEEEMP